MIENVARPDAAIENLTNHQQQADMDGTFVTVSRQALDEVLTYIAAMTVQAEPVFAWRYTRADGHFFLTPQRCRDGYPEADGWSEEALYTGPTPHEGCSDAE